jgi:hypothetical protein
MGESKQICTGNHMAKKRSRKPKSPPQQNKPESKPEKAKSPWWSHISLTWKIIGVLSLLIGLVTSYFAFVPKISLTLGEQMLPSDSLSVPFVIANDNPFPIYSVQMNCSIENLVGATAPVDFEGKKVSFPLTGFGTEDTPPIDLEAGEKVTLACSGKKENNPDVDLSQITNAEIIITIKFRPFWIFWTQEKYFRFGTIPTSSGRLGLIPMENKKPSLDGDNRK